jgi:tetratricopeptide (TPR) repeat protein
LRDAIGLLERAVATDSTLAPAWEHLAWALIRLGDRERAAAALAQLQRWASGVEESEIHLPSLLRMAYQFRFGDPGGQGEVVGTLSRSPEVLALAARGALSFDLPEAQAALGAALAATGSHPSARASGQVARGVALVALGRPAAGQLSFDSAATMFPDPTEARLQTAEWRIVPAALGVAGWSAGEQARGRAALRALSGDSSLGARARWALSLDAYSRGDTTEARARGQVVIGSERERGLAPMLTGLAHAARGDWEAALAATEPALAFDSAGHTPDPFFRAALHLNRGEWLERLGRASEADRSWLWYENLDVRAWPAAEVQPAEVDWALASHARSRRARLALERGDRSEGCALARRVGELWAKAEPEVATLAGELAEMARGCPR